MKRKFAANRILTETGVSLVPGVVEVEDSQVRNVSHLIFEQPFTEWIGGTISLSREDNGHLQAFKDGRMLTA